MMPTTCDIRMDESFLVKPEYILTGLWNGAGVLEDVSVGDEIKENALEEKLDLMRAGKKIGEWSFKTIRTFYENITYASTIDLFDVDDIETLRTVELITISTNKAVVAVIENLPSIIDTYKHLKLRTELLHEGIAKFGDKIVGINTIKCGATNAQLRFIENCEPLKSIFDSATSIDEIDCDLEMGSACLCPVDGDDDLSSGTYYCFSRRGEMSYIGLYSYRILGYINSTPQSNYSNLFHLLAENTSSFNPNLNFNEIILSREKEASLDFDFNVIRTRVDYVADAFKTSMVVKFAKTFKKELHEEFAHYFAQNIIPQNSIILGLKRITANDNVDCCGINSGRYKSIGAAMDVSVSVSVSLGSNENCDLKIGDVLTGQTARHSYINYPCLPESPEDAEGKILALRDEETWMQVGRYHYWKIFDAPKTYYLNDLEFFFSLAQSSATATETAAAPASTIDRMIKTFANYDQIVVVQKSNYRVHYTSKNGYIVVKKLNLEKYTGEDSLVELVGAKELADVYLNRAGVPDRRRLSLLPPDVVSSGLKPVCNCALAASPKSFSSNLDNACICPLIAFLLLMLTFLKLKFGRC